MTKYKKVKVVVFYASTESGDKYLAILPRKLTKREFDAYCRENHPDEFEDGMSNEDCLHGEQIELEVGQEIQL